MRLTCVSIDDEPLARECIVNYVREVDFLEMVGTGNNPLELSKIQEQHRVDVLFLDIQMPRMNGIEFLKTSPNPPLVILTTAFPNYALEGFELDVMDYLLKPITFNRFYKAVTKTKAYFELMNQDQLAKNKKESDPDYIFIKSNHAYVKIFLDEILFIEAMQNYVIFHTLDQKKCMTLMPLKRIEEKLDTTKFARVHKSYIVSLAKIEKLDHEKIEIGPFQIPLSRNYKNALTEKVLRNKLWEK